MKYDEFVGNVQHRCRVGTPGEAVKATRATLEVLAQRLFSEEKNHLASQLPGEIAYYLEQVKENSKFDLDAFFQKVSEKEGEDLPVAVHHARSVMSVVKDAVTPGQWENLIEELPEEFAPLFDSGSEGEMKTG